MSYRKNAKKPNNLGLFQHATISIISCTGGEMTHKNSAWQVLFSHMIAQYVHTQHGGALVCVLEPARACTQTRARAYKHTHAHIYTCLLYTSDAADDC